MPTTSRSQGRLCRTFPTFHRVIQMTMRFINRHPVTLRFIDLARSHAVAAGEFMSIIGCIAWIVPCSLYADYLQTSPYLRRVAEYLPRPVMIGVFASLFVFQVHALLMIPKKPQTSLYHERERYAYHRVRWMERRAIGLRIAMFVWAIMSYLFTIDRLFTSGSITYALLVVLCAVGQYVVGQVDATSEREWPALLKLVDDAELIVSERQRAEHARAGKSDRRGR